MSSVAAASVPIALWWTWWQRSPPDIRSESESRVFPALAARPDCLNGYLDLTDALLRGESSGDTQFRTGHRLSCQGWSRDQRCCGSLGTDSLVELDPGPHDHEAVILALDSRKAELKLEWRSSLKFHEALAWTVA
jgi:hypothetical protein